MISVAQFSALTDDLQEIFSEHAADAVAEMKSNMLFDVRDTERRTYDYRVTHGVSVIKRVVENQDLPRATGSQGDGITWTQARYGGIVSVTKDMRKFDLYNEIESVVRSITDEAFDLIDQSAVDVLLYGTSTSYTDVYGETQTSTTPDGLSLFSSAHTNNVTSTTFSNLVNDGSNNNPALSREAIRVTRANALKHTDVHGLTRPVMLDTLYVGPSNEDLAERILFSPQIPGEANNDLNSLKGKIKKLVTWERQDLRSDSTDTSAYFFMCDSRKSGETLKMHFAERPSLDSPEEVYANKNWDYSLDYYNFLGRGWPAYVYGSTGVN